MTLVPIHYDNFKIFMHHSLGESRVFVNNIRIKIWTASQYQLEELMDWATHLKHLQVVLKEFNAIVAPSKDLLIGYFRDGLKLSIYAQLDKKNRDLENWQDLIKQTIDTKAKVGWQPFSLLWERDTCYLWYYKQMKDKESKNKKNFEAKKTSNNSSANGSNSGSQLWDQLSRSNQTNLASSRSTKKDFRPHYRAGQCQKSNIPATDIDTTAVKKDKKIKVDFSQIQCYNCHQNGYYTNKCSNKNSKNKCQS